jgi:hypothetical protein
MKYKIIAAVFFLSTTYFAQSRDTVYYLTAEAGAGYSRYITTMNFPNLNQNGFSGTLRVMWHPEHLLSIGLETGYQELYSIETTLSVPDAGTSEASASMNSVPVMAVFSMRVLPIILPEFELKFSSGIFLLYNQGNAFGEIKSSQISIGYSAGAAYLYPLNDKISYGAEVKYNYISKIQDADVSIQAIFSYKFLHW